jgi:poly(hydroxyalkanoate) depolymerase family esterase
VPAPAVPARRAASKPVPARGEWVGGIAPGPAGARRYHLYIPPGLALKADEKLPLLVMLHGCGQTGSDLAAATRMNRLAARERFLVLYPEQERMANAHGCWNWFERRNGKAQAEAATLLAAVDKGARRYPVDLARVAVAGLSAGASMAVLMAALYPQRFCAVAMHSGVAPGTAESAATALAAMHGRRAAHLPEPLGVSLNRGPTPSMLPLPPLLVLHGDADGVVSVRNAAATALLWADALGARAGALRTLQRGQRHAMRVTEFKTRGRTVVALREVAGLAHAWSGGVAQLPFSDPAGPDASALVWAFVARQFAKK